MVSSKILFGFNETTLISIDACRIQYILGPSILESDSLVRHRIESSFNDIKLQLSSHLRNQTFETRELKKGWTYKCTFSTFEISDLKIKMQTLERKALNSVTQAEYWTDFMIFGNVAMNVKLDIVPISNENNQKQEQYTLLTQMTIDKFFLQGRAEFVYLDSLMPNQYEISASLVNLYI